MFGIVAFRGVRLASEAKRRGMRLSWTQGLLDGEERVTTKNPRGIEGILSEGCKK